MDGGMLSQEEINALLSGIDTDSEKAEDSSTSQNSSNNLTEAEKDALGELSNISMGSAATALFSLLNQKVNITTPKVSYANWNDLLASYSRPAVFVQIYYKEGIQGNNVFILNERDVKIITSLMMGGDGTNLDEELTDLHLSAISEAMNQMMGSASTSLSSILETRIDISPPNSSLVDLNENIDKEEIAPFLKGDFVKVSFQLEIGDLINSTLMQLYPVEFAKELYKRFMKYAGIEQPEIAESTPPPKAAPEPQQTVPQQQTPPPNTQQAYPPNMQQGYPPNMQQAYPPNMQQGYPPNMQQPYSQYVMPQMQDVNIAPVQFQPFVPTSSPLFQSENIDLLLDVPLEVTAELGRTSKSIKEILDFAPGTIIELNRLAGEAIDVMVNGKYVAKGEVVLIDEAFGIKVTEIIK